ncbi:hypothetical protein H5410_005779 [Solanum commersonii]|uniref:Uncharacterized protein n=1 Tax=Solanum commersonii TaxID=4109 RepID=A0A9J6A7S3_SOLCO|nr:hypothetical protein H5410_005779 [Solanum commersonii]
MGGAFGWSGRQISPVSTFLILQPAKRLDAWIGILRVSLDSGDDFRPSDSKREDSTLGVIIDRFKTNNLLNLLTCLCGKRQVSSRPFFDYDSKHD